MQSELGTCLRNTRLAQRLSPQQLARDVGYQGKGVEGGARRILALEQRGVLSIDDSRLLGLLIARLHIRQRTVDRLFRRDELSRKWDQYQALMSLPASVVVHYAQIHFAKVQRTLPCHLQHATFEAKLSYASELARSLGKPVTLFIPKHSPAPAFNKPAWFNLDCNGLVEWYSIAHTIIDPPIFEPRTVSDFLHK